MKLILLTFFLGSFGSYRFYKKEYKIAVLYIFTGGLLGIGYLYDLYLSFAEYFITKNSTSESDTNEEFVKKSKNKAILATFICAILIVSAAIASPATTEDPDDGYSSSSSSWDESYSTCKSCGKKVQRKYLYSGFCGKCYSKWSNAD